MVPTTRRGVDMRQNNTAAAMLCRGTPVFARCAPTSDLPLGLWGG
jgi:hypothetical protein